jgi:hypothetical protein
MHRVTEPDEWTVPGDGASRLDLRLQGGNLRIVGTAADEIQIRAVKTARGGTEADARAFLELMEVERRRDGSRWVVDAR